MTGNTRSNNAPLLGAAILIVIAVLGSYWPSLDSPFILDDQMAIVKNQQLKSGGSVLSSLVPPDLSLGRPRWRGPVVEFTLAVNHAVGRYEPRGYHIFNMALHALASLLVFGIIRRTLLLDGLRERFEASAFGLALASALIWSVHPLLTDSVTYVTQRTMVIMAIFYLATLYFTIRAATSDRSMPWSIGAVLCCLLGMLSKEAMATAPVLIVLYDRIFLCRSWREVRQLRGRLHLALAATWFALFWLISVSPHPGNIGFGLRMGPFGYLLAQTEVITHYLLQVFWPVGLILDYGPAYPVTLGAAVVPGLVLLVLLGVSIWSFRRTPRLAYLGAWFFLILAPTSSLVPIVDEVGAERRMYLPLLAIVVVVVLGLWYLLQRLVIKRNIPARTALGVVIVLAMVTVLTLGTATRARNQQYNDPLGLWEDTVTKVPRNQRAHYNLARALGSHGRHAEAVPVYEEALRLWPLDFRAHNNLANALQRLGRAEEAVPHFREVIRLDPQSPLAYNGLGMALGKLGKLEEAERQFLAALKVRPNYFPASFNLGRLYEAQGQIDNAIGEYRRTLGLRPDHADARKRLSALDGS